MKGYRFYLEYPDEKSKNDGTRKKLGNHCGTIVALMLENNNLFSNINNEQCTNVIKGVRLVPNSVVAESATTLNYLSSNCKWVSEETARKIHPELFKRIDR